MTGRILNINAEPEPESPPKPPRSVRKFLPLLLAMAVLYATSTFVLARMIPEPHSTVDYLIIGTFATLLCLLVLLVVVVRRAGLGLTRRPR